MSDSGSDSVFDFPCKFPIKAMGRASADFEPLVRSLVLSHAVLHPGEQVTVTSSGEGNFLSVTIVITAQSRDQLNRIYQDLSDCAQILMAL